MVGEFAMRTTSPFSFIIQPVASMMGSGTVVVVLLVTVGLLWLSLLGLRVIKST